MAEKEIKIIFYKYKKIRKLTIIALPIVAAFELMLGKCTTVKLYFLQAGMIDYLSGPIGMGASLLRLWTAAKTRSLIDATAVLEEGHGSNYYQ